MKSVSTKQTLDIGEVVQLTGVPPATLRFYEEKGLIRSTGRHGLRRLFQAHVLQQLQFITLGKHAGLTLEEIASMFTSEGKLLVDRNFLFQKADEIEKSIHKLSAIQNTLLHVAKCSAPNHMECPKFQRLLEVAGKKKPRRRTTARK
ncbi:helix-turn-helix domain-containing protein [Bdellovibrio sp. HCB-162]|uniref:helix-turn-helix domain-containing protein n=1 Tax=Bdellovibrio sp. HCB-162 TaxID=3394234 RepID=UPI0039BCDE95